MPYKRTYKRYQKKRYAPSVNRRIAQLARKIDQNIENKQITVSLQATYGAITTNWTESDLTNISQGTGSANRIGRKIRIKSIEIKGVIANGDAETALDDPYNVVRCVIGLWAGPAGSTPLATALTTIQAPIRKNLGTRNYLVTKFLDRYIPLTVTSTEKGAGDGYTPMLKSFKYYKRFKTGILITYGDDTTSYPDKRLILGMVSDSTAVPSPGFVVGYLVMTYEDA